MATTTINVRVDEDLKRRVESIYSELGMNLSTAINVFLRASVRYDGIPFDMRLENPNDETIAAMLEAEKIAKDPNVKHYHSVKELFSDLEADEE